MILQVRHLFKTPDYKCKRGASSTTALIIGPGVIIGITGLLVAASGLITRVAIKR